MEFDLPHDIIRSHVLPNMGAQDVRFLLEKSRETNDVDFVKNYLLPAYQSMGLKEDTEMRIRDEMVKSAIDILPFEQLVRFLTDVEFPLMCESNSTYENFQQIWHHVIRRYEHRCLHCFVTCCPQCTWAAYHAAIDVNILTAFQDLMAHSAHYPSFDHILRLLLKHDRLAINTIIDYLNDDDHISFKNDLRTVCNEFMDMANDLDSWIDAEDVPWDMVHQVSRVSNSSNSKHGRWVLKQLRRIQKAVGVPKIALMIRQAASKIDAIPNIFDEEDDFNMYDDF
jgi:hypothetical protein